jgi:hypothetical protein
MLARLLISLVLGFILATAGVVLFPDLGRAAGPLVCQGELAPEPNRLSRVSFRCIEARGGLIRPVDAGRVMSAAIPAFGLLVFAPVSLLVGRVERRIRSAKALMEADLARAVEGTARVLALSEGGLPIQRRLNRVAELTIELEVRSPPGRLYRTQVLWVVDYLELRRVAIGRSFPIRVNPLRPERVYPAESWAELVWWNE